MNHRQHLASAVITHAVNEGWRLGAFDPQRPDVAPHVEDAIIMFDTAPLLGIPMRVFIRDWRFGEAGIHVAAWPTDDVDRWIRAGNADSLAGELFVTAWLERSPRLRIVSPLDLHISIARHRLPDVSRVPAPAERRDPLGLYPRYLSYAEAA